LSFAAGRLLDLVLFMAIPQRAQIQIEASTRRAGL
jgi:hypothetical protein